MIPVSAMNCLNWLHSALHLMIHNGHAEGAPGSESYATPAAAISLVALLRLTHGDPRAYIAADLLVTRHALALLQDLNRELPPGPRRDAVRLEYRALLEAARRCAPDAPELASWPETPAEPAPASGLGAPVKV